MFDQPYRQHKAVEKGDGHQVFVRLRLYVCACKCACVWEWDGIGVGMDGHVRACVRVYEGVCAR